MSRFSEQDTETASLEEAFESIADTAGHPLSEEDIAIIVEEVMPEASVDPVVG